MTDKTMRRSGSASTIAATPLAAVLLLLPCAVPAEAGWLARGTGVAGAGNALKENLGDLTDRFSEMLDAATSNNAAKAADIWEAVEETPGRIIEDAFPVVKAVLKLPDAVVSAKEGVKDRLKSAERKIGRFVARTGEAAADARAALAIGRSERDWYESKTRLLAKAPLQPVRVAAARSRPPLPKSDPWGAAPPAAARNPDPWGASGGGETGRAALPSVWDAKETPAGVAAGTREDRELSVQRAKAAVARAWEARSSRLDGSDDAYAAALGVVLGDDPTTGSGDYRAALGALETREAERREAERVAAAQREAERREAERVAAARREQEERERRMLREAENSRARYERFANTLQQMSDALDETTRRYMEGQAGGSDGPCREKARFVPTYEPGQISTPPTQPGCVTVGGMNTTGRR